MFRIVALPIKEASSLPVHSSEFAPFWRPDDILDAQSNIVIVFHLIFNPEYFFSSLQHPKATSPKVVFGLVIPLN